MNIEGITTAAIEHKIFNSALAGGSKSKDDDKKKKKKPAGKSKLPRAGSTLNSDSIQIEDGSTTQLRNTDTVDEDEEEKQNPMDGSGSIDEIEDGGGEDGVNMSRSRGKRQQQVTVSDKFTGGAFRQGTLPQDDDVGVGVSNWNSN